MDSVEKLLGADACQLAKLRSLQESFGEQYTRLCERVDHIEKGHVDSSERNTLSDQGDPHSASHHAQWHGEHAVRNLQHAALEERMDYIENLVRSDAVESAKFVGLQRRVDHLEELLFHNGTCEDTTCQGPRAGRLSEVYFSGGDEDSMDKWNECDLAHEPASPGLEQFRELFGKLAGEHSSSFDV